MLHDHNDQPSNDAFEPLDASATPLANDSFNPEDLRLSQDFAGSIGVRKLITTVPTRKPNRQEFIRVHPDPAYRLETVALELKEEREFYLVDRPLWSELPGELSPRLLVTAVTRQGVVVIWPLRLPGTDGRQDAWGRSAMKAAQIAMQRWVKVVANMALGAYEVYAAEGDLPEPDWPALSFPELLKIGFKDRFIREVDHPVPRKLRGEL